MPQQSCLARHPSAAVCSSRSTCRLPIPCRSAAAWASQKPGRGGRAQRAGRWEPLARQDPHAARSAAYSGPQPGSSRSRSSSHSAAPAAPASREAAAVAHGSGRLLKPEGANNIKELVELNEFRRGVGLCIYRPDGLVFAARRMDDKQQSWQMPQGGIDPRENPMQAALRELHEETGIRSCRIVASIDHWLEYTFPTKVKAEAGESFLRYRGQTQKWFLLEFTGDDSEIDLSCHGHPEFSEYSWMRLEALPAGVVHFKQGVYAQVARNFAPEIARRVGAARWLAS